MYERLACSSPKKATSAGLVPDCRMTLLMTLTKLGTETGVKLFFHFRLFFDLKTGRSELIRLSFP